jgi:hypothetical protein
LLRRQHLDEAVREHVEAVGLRDVTIERGGVELREDEDALQIGVQTVADRNVDQPVLPPERNRRLGPHVGERKQSCPAAAAQDQRQNIVHVSIILAPTKSAGPADVVCRFGLCR